MSGMAKVVDHSVVQRRSRSTLRKPSRLTGIESNPADRILQTEVGEVETSTTGTREADHGVVRDFAAAFAHISRRSASRWFLFGSGRVRLESAAGAARLMGVRRSPSAGSARAAGASVESAARHPHANAVRRAREQLSAGHRKAPRAGPSDIETAIPRVRRHVSGRRQSSHSAVRPHLRPRRLAVVRHRLCLRTVSQTCRPAFLSIPVALMFVAGRPTHFQGSLIP